MAKAEDKRIADLEAELTKAQVERDTYLASAQTMNRMSEKLLDLDDFRLMVNEQLKQQSQGNPVEASEHFESEAHEDPEGETDANAAGGC